ncbi:MAG: mechanosensitive ion channel family protein [Hyphomonas sp.]
MDTDLLVKNITDWWTENAPGWAHEPFAYIGSIWNEGAYGLTYGEIITVTGILVLALLVRGIFARTIVRWITRAAAGTKTQIDDALVRAVSTPLKIIPVIAGVFASLQILDVDPTVETYATKIIQSIVTLTVFWTLARAVQALEYVFGNLRETLSSSAVDWMIKALQFLLVALGLGAVAQQWGIAIAPLLAGLGVFGIAIGLGAQDLFKNLISGLLIIGEKRFVPGEWIAVDGIVEGTVEKINFRSTLIRRFDKSPVYVPNSKLSDAVLTNFSRMSQRRIRWVVGVEYRTTVDQLKYIRDEIEAWLVTDSRFAAPPEAPLFVRIDTFNASSIDFLIYAFTRTTNWGEWLAIKEEFAFAIMQIIERAGTAFAFPSQTVYLQHTDPPEIMSPPPSRELARSLQAELRGTDNTKSSGESDGAS